MSADLREALIEAKKHIEALEAEITRLMAPPNGIATVQKVVAKDKILVAGPQGSVLLEPGEKLDIKKLRPGDLVSINGAGQIVESLDVPLAGPEATVKRVFEDSDMLELEGAMGGALIFKGRVEKEVKAGDTVKLDRSGTVALEVIPKDIQEHSVETATGVEWKDIGGQELAVSILKEAIEGPLKHTALYKAYGKKPLKGVLMSGPPGCGKTLIAKATANAVREAHGGKEAQTGFIYVKGPEVLNMWVGNTEAQIRSLFQRAREHKEAHGYPAVLFIDEADAILGKRGTSAGSVLASTVVPTFLAEMDGLTDSGAFVLLATNRPDVLDPAIVREGRIDRKVVVGRPDQESAVQILKIHLSKTKLDDTATTLATCAASRLYDPANVLYRVSLKAKGVKVFTMQHLVSGAMLAGVVDAATSVAIRRDLAKGKPSGLNREDMEEAVDGILKANRNLNHDDDLMLFAEHHGDEIQAVQRMAA